MHLDEREFPTRPIDLDFPAHIIAGVADEDVPLLTKIIMALLAVSWEKIERTVRSITQVQLSEDGLEYTVNVRFPESHHIDFRSLQSVWSAAPTNLVGIVVGPWHYGQTGRTFMNVSAIVRRVRAPISGRFRMLQQTERSLRHSRSALADAQSGRETRALVLGARDAKNPPKRRPWEIVANMQDRNVVHSIVMMCFDMTTSAARSEFWNTVKVTENMRGRADRITVRVAFEKHPFVDALIGASLLIKHPADISDITFSLGDTASRGAASEKQPPLVMEIEIYSQACDIVHITEVNVVSIYNSMRVSNDDRSAVHISGPSESTRAGAESLDPVEAALHPVGLTANEASPVEEYERTKRPREFSYSGDEAEELTRPAKTLRRVSRPQPDVETTRAARRRPSSGSSSKNQSGWLSMFGL